MGRSLRFSPTAEKLGSIYSHSLSRESRSLPAQEYVLVVLVSFKCQPDAMQNHLEVGLNEELARSGWPLGMSVEDILTMNQCKEM